MTYRIEGYCIINKLTGQRWGGLYESEQGAILSFNTMRTGKQHPSFERKMKFKDQDIFIVQPLVLIE